MLAVYTNLLPACWIDPFVTFDVHVSAIKVIELGPFSINYSEAKVIWTLTWLLSVWYSGWLKTKPPDGIKPLPEAIWTSQSFSGIHLRAIPKDMLKMSTLGMILKPTNLRLQPDLPGTKVLRLYMLNCFTCFTCYRVNTGVVENQYLWMILTIWCLYFYLMHLLLTLH